MKRVYVVNANNVSTPCKFTVASDAANFVRDLLVDGIGCECHCDYVENDEYEALESEEAEV
jgi:hypothetical protein